MQSVIHHASDLAQSLLRRRFERTSDGQQVLDRVPEFCEIIGIDPGQQCWQCGNRGCGISSHDSCLLADCMLEMTE